MNLAVAHRSVYEKDVVNYLWFSENWKENIELTTNLLKQSSLDLSIYQRSTVDPSHIIKSFHIKKPTESNIAKNILGHTFQKDLNK